MPASGLTTTMTFRADNNDDYLSLKKLDEKVARLHIAAHVEALKQIVRIRARVPLHLQPPPPPTS